MEAKNGKVKQLTKEMYTSSLRAGPNGKKLAFLSQNASQPYELYVSNKDGGKTRNISRVNDSRLNDIEMTTEHHGG